MSPSKILLAAVGAALALTACTPERHTADDARPASSASPRGSGAAGYGAAGGGAAGGTAAMQRDDENDSDRNASGSRAGEQGDEAGDSSHGGFGDSGTAGASG